MDSVEARREARRRRILENSEQRLKKITGVENRSNNPNNYNIQTLINDNNVDNNLEIDNIEEQLTRLQTTLQQPQEVENPAELKPEGSFYCRHKLKIVAILAVVNYCSYWNLIFVPLILLEVTFWLMCPMVETNSRLNLLLNFVNLRDEFSKNLLHTLNYITQILQDLMIYFFVYVCCNLLANFSKFIPLL